MNATSALDPAALEHLRKLGGDGFALKMIDLFVSYVETKVAEARLAQRAGNLTGVAEATHPIKSSAGNVGAARLQECASRIEKLAKAAKPGEVAALMDEFERAFEEVKPLLEAAKAGLNPGPV